jgi:endonuclease III
MVLWENVAYLLDDEHRERAFRALRDTIGTRPSDILAAPWEALYRVAQLGGMHPENRVEKLRAIARIAQQELGGDLSEVVRRPLAQAKRALQKFPGIGAPGAEKILLFAHAIPLLALESNGLRVLLRLGFAEEKKNYAASYRAVQDRVRAELGDDCAWLVRVHQLLRRHGKEVCRRSEPSCEVCPLTGGCRHYAEQAP